MDAKHLEGELERVSMQLVAASLGHAQAEQVRSSALNPKTLTLIQPRSAMPGLKKVSQP